MTRGPLVVVHSIPVWLRQTMTWVYSQVRYLPGDQVESHVFCDTVENANQFPLEHVHSLEAEARLARVLTTALRRVHLRRLSGYALRIARERHALRIARALPADIVHSHFGPTGWRNLKLLERTGARHIVSFYGYDVSRLPQVAPQWHDRYARLFADADVFLCEGPHMVNSLVALGCPESKIKVLALGVDLGRLPYRPRSWNPGEPLRVLIAASFREKKGIPYALRALGRLQEHVRLEITVIGDADNEGHSQRERDLILAVLRDEGLEDKTRLLGYQPHHLLLAEAYTHHVFLSPSITAQNGDTEGGAPVTVIEMMASGMPIVSTLHCDIPHVVDYGIADWLVPERDVEALVERLRWLVEHADNWGAMLDMGRKRAIDMFDVREQARQLAAIYEDLSGVV